MLGTALRVIVFIAALILSLASGSSVQADTIGPLTPTSVSSNAFGSSDPWVSPGSAIGSDDVRATSTTTAANNTTHFLIFTFSPGIPPGSTLNGLEVFLEAQSGGSAGSPSAFVPATINALVFNFLPSVFFMPIPPGPADTVVTYGGATDTWGGLTAADINSADFRVGCFMGDGSDTSTDTYSLDAVTMTVHFTPVVSVPASSPLSIIVTLLLLAIAGGLIVLRLRRSSMIT